MSYCFVNIDLLMAVRMGRKNTASWGFPDLKTSDRHKDLSLCLQTNSILVIQPYQCDDFEHQHLDKLIAHS